MIRDCKILKDLPPGGQKNIQLAEHPENGKVVIKKGPIKSFTFLERIKREVELLSELDSKYYPKQFHFNIDLKTKEFEIVEEFIDGKMLRDCMNRFESPNDILWLLNNLTKGLSIIWERNIVHRDLKPENLIIRPDGFPCIIDLGIARFNDMESLTKTISPYGPCTPIYAAPEQLINKKNLIDHRTDFFSLGIMVMELYLGVHPFDPDYVKNNFSIVENILQNLYVCETKDIAADQAITGFAKKTLQTQPYNRFRNIKLIKNFIVENLKNENLSSDRF